MLLSLGIAWCAHVFLFRGTAAGPGPVGAPQPAAAPSTKGVTAELERSEQASRGQVEIDLDALPTIDAALASLPSATTTGSLRIQFSANSGPAQATTGQRCRVSEPGGDKRHELVSDERGQVELPVLEPGACWIETEVADPLRAVIQAGSTTSVVINVPSALSVTGTVLGPDGKPVAEAAIFVSLRGDPRAMTQRVLTQEDGRFWIHDLRARSYLQARKAGFCESNAVEASEDTARNSLLLVLGRSLHFSGRVEDESGRAIGGATIEIGAKSRSAGPEAELGSAGIMLTGWSTQSAADGSFSLADVPEGEWPMTVSARGFATRRIELTTQTSDLLVRLVPEVVLSGRVVDELGSAVPAAQVRCFVVGSDLKLIDYTTADGSFAIDGLTASSSVELIARAAGDRSTRMQIELTAVPRFVELVLPQP